VFQGNIVGAGLRCLFFASPCPLPSALRVFFLRFFGAKNRAGRRHPLPREHHIPWKLTLGDHVWLGEDAGC